MPMTVHVEARLLLSVHAAGGAQAEGLLAMDNNGLSDPYAILKLTSGDDCQT